ncbi:MAG TPA: folate-binding protein, partial [Xanthobacteraceae bacterium]|nr:folate-binding protein [Xanthobacteraceae bacterium]
MRAALLPDRGLISVEGAEAKRFLNGLLTADIGKVTPDAPRFAALLSPQGKILVDCIAIEAPDHGILLDCPKTLAPGLAERLAFYKLRAAVTIEDLSATHGVVALWDGAAPDLALAYPDPRVPALGARMIVALDEVPELVRELKADFVDAALYEQHRIALGVPRGGLDFIYGDAFPHEADMDQLNGVDFDKGCYVGQEVVSRMEHRGHARTRIVCVRYEGFAPESGIPVLAGEKQIGHLGSTAHGNGLALLRLDRLAEALAAGVPLTAGGIALQAVKPRWANFAFPGEQ